VEPPAKRQALTKKKSKDVIFAEDVYPKLLHEVKELEKQDKNIVMEINIVPEDAVFKADDLQGTKNIVQTLKGCNKGADIAVKISSYLLGRILFMAQQHFKSSHGEFTQFIEGCSLSRATTYRAIQWYLLMLQVCYCERAALWLY
jgi:F0F1-type ATP synthase beta subunit